MATLETLISLFSSLAVNLQTLHHTSPTNHHRQNHHQQQAQSDDVDLDLSISNFTRSLNFSDDHSSVRVLDTALSLMCFKAPQVFNSVIQCSVRTIITVLTSSIQCKVLQTDENDILLVGSSIPPRDYGALIKVVSDAISKLEDHVVRVLVSASSCRYSVPSKCMILDAESGERRGTDVAKLLRYLPEEFPLENNEIPLRLCFWHLDPLILKKDISEILKEIIKRPFCCSRKEFYERMDWRSIITEESGLEFICQVKLRSGKYLVKCIKRLTRLCSDKDGILMRKDLLNRLENWRHQGREVLELHRDLDDAIKDLNLKVLVGRDY